MFLDAVRRLMIFRVGDVQLSLDFAFVDLFAVVVSGIFVVLCGDF